MLTMLMVVLSTVEPLEPLAAIGGAGLRESCLTSHCPHALTSLIAR